MSDATRCGECGWVYWTTYRENWGTCTKCGLDNDRSEKGATLIGSEHIFTFAEDEEQRIANKA